MMSEQQMQAVAAAKAIPVGYKQTDAGVIPEDWDLEKLGMHAIFRTGPFGSALHKADYVYGGIPIINPMQIVDGKLEPTATMAISNDAGRKLHDFRLFSGDIVIGRRGEMGRCAVVSDNEDGWICGTGSMIVRVRSSCDSHFIQMALSSPSVISAIESASVGSTMININQATLRQLEVVIPRRRNEQTAIANVLSDTDALISALEQLIAKKQAIKTATMQQLLTGRTRLPAFALRPDGTPKGYKPSELGDIPVDWEVETIGRVCDLLTGYPFPSNKYSDSGIRLLRGSNVKRGVTDWSSDITQYWPVLSKEIKQYELLVGDVVISMDGSLVGRSFAQLTEDDLPAVLLQRVARIRSVQVSQCFLKEWICNPFFTEHCDSVKTVTAIPHVSPQDIRDFKFLLPPTMQEQTAIATILSDMDNELQALTQKLEKARALKQGMMQQLLTGKIRLPLASITTQGASDAN